jgi:hypothetical protein
MVLALLLQPSETIRTANQEYNSLLKLSLYLIEWLNPELDSSCIRSPTRVWSNPKG